MMIRRFVLFLAVSAGFSVAPMLSRDGECNCESVDGNGTVSACKQSL